MEKLEVKIINKSGNKLPFYASEGSSGVDLLAYLHETVEIPPFQRVLIPTGIYMELPIGYEAQVRPRSGLALKSGVTVLNTPGTIDSDYRGEIGVILINLSDKTFVVNNGDRIAQMVISKYEIVSFSEVSELTITERGEGGFGHSGVN
jgi:dUTP pyrophosphatase